MSLRGQALQEFDLPTAPQRIDELPPVSPDAEAWRVHAPAGRFLLLCASPSRSQAPSIPRIGRASSTEISNPATS